MPRLANSCLAPGYEQLLTQSHAVLLQSPVSEAHLTFRKPWLGPHGAWAFLTSAQCDKTQGRGGMPPTQDAYLGPANLPVFLPREHDLGTVRAKGLLMWKQDFSLETCNLASKFRKGSKTHQLAKCSCRKQDAFCEPPATGSFQAF